MLVRDNDTPRAPVQLRGAARDLCSCIPTGGPRHRLVSPVVVDDHLVWVAQVPTLPLGAARPSSPGALVRMCVQLTHDLAAARGVDAGALATDDDLVHAAAQAVAEYLADLPELPFIGEPFGGEEGTD